MSSLDLGYKQDPGALAFGSSPELSGRKLPASIPASARARMKISAAMLVFNIILLYGKSLVACASSRGDFLDNQVECRARSGPG